MDGWRWLLARLEHGELALEQAELSNGERARGVGCVQAERPGGGRARAYILAMMAMTPGIFRAGAPP